MSKIHYEVVKLEYLDEAVVSEVARDIIEYLVGAGLLPLDDLQAKNPNSAIEVMADNYVVMKMGNG